LRTGRFQILCLAMHRFINCKARPADSSVYTELIFSKKVKKEDEDTNGTENDYRKNMGSARYQS